MYDTVESRGSRSQLYFLVNVQKHGHKINRAPRVQTKEFLLGLKGAHKLTHDMSFARKGFSPVTIAGKPRGSGPP